MEKQLLENKIQSMIEDGFSIKKVALTLGVPKKEIQLYNFTNIKEKYSLEKLLELYKIGVSANALAYKFDKADLTISKIVENYGVKRNTSQCRTYHIFNQKKFDNISNIENITYLGLLYADGSINKNHSLELTLKLEDEQRLHQFISHLEFITYPTLINKSYKKKNGEIGFYKRLLITNKYLNDQLINLGVINNKSLILKYPLWINDLENAKEAHRSFIRGYWEGDGTIYFSIEKGKITPKFGFGIIGTEDMCENIKSILEKEVNVPVHIDYISRTENNTFNIRVNGNRQIKKIMDFLYLNHNENNRLDRKYKKYLFLCEIVSNLELIENERIDRDNKIISLFEEGFDKNKISNQLFLDKEIVRGVLRRNNIL